MGGEQEELAIFLQWIDALRASLSRYSTVILPATLEPFHLSNLKSPTDGHGIPQPASTQPGVAGVEPPAGVGMSKAVNPEQADG